MDTGGLVFEKMDTSVAMRNEAAWRLHNDQHNDVEKVSRRAHAYIL